MDLLITNLVITAVGVLGYMLGRHRWRARFNAINDLVDMLGAEVAGWRECNFLIKIGDAPVVMATLGVLRDIHIKSRPAPARVSAKTPDGATYTALEPMRILPRVLSGPSGVEIVISKMPDAPALDFGLTDLPPTESRFKALKP